MPAGVEQVESDLQQVCATHAVAAIDHPGKHHHAVMAAAQLMGRLQAYAGSAAITVPVLWQQQQ